MNYIIWHFKQHSLDIHIAWHTIIILNVVFLVVIAFIIVKTSFRLFIVRLIHDLMLNLLNSLKFYDFSNA